MLLCMYLSRTRLGLLFPLLIARVAQPAGVPETNSPQACTRIVADASRLACYDAAFGVTPSARMAPPSAPAAPPARVQPPAAAAAPNQDAEKFGDYGQLARDRLVKSSVPDRVSGRITQLSVLPDGMYRLTLDNAQTWQTTQSDWALSFKAGDQVQITKMRFGGYQVSVTGNNRSVGAKRTQ
jgi:hypothetical protein